jgi:hypothetical protein
MQAVIQKAKESDVEELSNIFTLYRIYYKKILILKQRKVFIGKNSEKESVIFIGMIEIK